MEQDTVQALAKIWTSLYALISTPQGLVVLAVVGTLVVILTIVGTSPPVEEGAPEGGEAVGIAIGVLLAVLLIVAAVVLFVIEAGGPRQAAEVVRKAVMRAAGGCVWRDVCVWVGGGWVGG